MPDQLSFMNVVLSIAGVMCFFVLTAMWGRLGALEVTDKQLTDQVSQIHILIVGEYIKREEILPQLDRIFDELKIIRSDLGRKVERRDT